MTVVSSIVLWRAVVIEAAVPDNYVPLPRVFVNEPDWSPADDSDAVASVLYALQAVPGGRQVRRDVLTDLTRPLVDSTEHVDAGVQALTTRRQAAVLRERKDATTVVECVTLTGDGRDAVQHGQVSSASGRR